MLQQTVIDSMISNQCCAFNVQIRLSPTTSAIFANVQKQLHNANAGHGWLCPEHAMHISVYSLLHVKEGQQEDKLTIWRKHGKQWISAIQEIASIHQEFTVHWTKLRVTREAVIAVGEDNGTLAKIRDAIGQVLSEQGHLRTYNIIHASLIRFQKQGPLPRVDGIELLDATDTVREMVITRERVYPSLQVDVVARAVLKAIC